MYFSLKLSIIVLHCKNRTFWQKDGVFGGCIQHYSSKIEAFFRQRPQVDNEKKPRLRGSVKGDNSAQNAKFIPNDKFVPEWEIQPRMSKSSLNEEDIPEWPIELRITKWAFSSVFVILFTQWQKQPKLFVISQRPKPKGRARNQNLKS